ncbi:MAG: hypothetical protein HQK58_04120 [Deltaproteobacteria bacterium]|nr:hypothetical protein [Deltaproteobacteria bacterium]
MTGLTGSDVQGHLAVAVSPLRSVVLISGILLVLIALLAVMRSRLLAGRKVELSGTWDCGYARPTARMQYTASSFAQPLTNMFGVLLQTHRSLERPEGFFPTQAGLHTETGDIFRRNVYRPIFQSVERLLLWLHWLQQGRVQIYILYIAVTMLILLIWNL